MKTRIIQLRFLEPMRIVKIGKSRNANGTYSVAYSDVMTVKCRMNQYMTYGNRNNIYDDVVNADDVGFTYRKRYIVSSPRNTLENFVDERMYNNADNIDGYRLIYKGEVFRMKDTKVTIEKEMDYTSHEGS